MDAHGPYIPPAEHQLFGRRRMEFSEALRLSGEYVAAARSSGGPQKARGMTDEIISLYDAEVHFADSSIGAVVSMLEEKGVSGRTVFVVASDHGEGFLEHGKVLHCNTLYEELLHVPLVVKIPGVAAARVAALTRNVDIAPTIFEVLGINARWEGRDGVSLLGVVSGGQGPEESAARLLVRMGRDSNAHNGMALFGALERGGVKYIGGWTPWRDFSEELYDLTADPGEKNDLADTRGEKVKELADALAGHRGAKQAVEEAGGDEDEAKRLQALGYLQ